MFYIATVADPPNKKNLMKRPDASSAIFFLKKIGYVDPCVVIDW